MSQIIDKLLKFVPLIPLGVMAVSGLAAYISLQNKVDGLERTAAKFSPEAVNTRLGYIEQSIQEIQRDIKELLRNQNKRV